MWMRRGQQRRIPSPGRNQKQPAFGWFNYASGEHRHHLPKTRKGYSGKNSTEFLVVVMNLVERARRTGRRVFLVLDNGPIHKAKRVQKVLEDPEIRPLLQVVWLPKYCPDLMLQERVWKHAKESGIANVLFSDRHQLRRHVDRVLTQINTDQDKAFTIVFGRRQRVRPIPENLSGSA
jgi:transposase